MFNRHSISFNQIFAACQNRCESVMILNLDYFVHRLFQNKDDGKLVEKNSASEEQDVKIEGLQLEVCLFLKFFHCSCCIDS